MKDLVGESAIAKNVYSGFSEVKQGQPVANIDAHAGTLRAALGASPLANPLNPPV